MAHSLLGTQIDMARPLNDDDLICSCRHRACTITSLWRAATAARADTGAIPDPLPFDLSDTTVTDIAVPVPGPAFLAPPPLVPSQRVA